MSTPVCKPRKKSQKALPSSFTHRQALSKLKPQRLNGSIEKVISLNRSSLKPKTPTEKSNINKTITIETKQDLEIESMYPTHLDVIERVRKIKNLSHCPLVRFCLLLASVIVKQLMEDKDFLLKNGLEKEKIKSITLSQTIAKALIPCLSASKKLKELFDRKMSSSIKFANLNQKSNWSIQREAKKTKKKKVHAGKKSVRLQGF